MKKQCSKIVLTSLEEKKISNVLNCAKCDQRLDEPRILQCGEYICAYCHMSIEVNNNKFKCCVCKEDHLMPEKGLPISKRLLEILALNPEEVYRSKEVKKLKEHVYQKILKLDENVNTQKSTV